MKLSLAKQIAATSMHDSIALSALISRIEGMHLNQACEHIEQRTGVVMPTTYAGRRCALRSIGCIVSDARVFKV